MTKPQMFPLDQRAVEVEPPASQPSRRQKLPLRGRIDRQEPGRFHQLDFRTWSLEKAEVGLQVDSFLDSGGFQKEPRTKKETTCKVMASSSDEHIT